MGLDICHVKPSFKTSEASEYFTLDEFSNFPEFIEKYSYLITIVETTDGGKNPVIYYVDKGYQRKQMKANFIEIFENDKLYFDLETVRKAQQFLQAKTEAEQREIEDELQLNFIDNFVEGESIFFISW